MRIRSAVPDAPSLVLIRLSCSLQSYRRCRACRRFAEGCGPGPETQHFEVARGEIVERVHRHPQVREHELPGDVFDVGCPPATRPHRFEKLLRWCVLADIACSSRLSAGYVDVVVVHVENQDARLRIRDLQARDHFYSTEAGQIQIENDQGGPCSRSASKASLPSAASQSSATGSASSNRRSPARTMG